MPIDDTNRQEAYTDLYTSLGVASMGLINEVPNDSSLIEQYLPAMREKVDGFLEENGVGIKPSVIIACILLLEKLHGQQETLGIELPHPNTLFGLIVKTITSAGEDHELPPNTSIN